jgi:hypothetical protein
MFDLDLKKAYVRFILSVSLLLLVALGAHSQAPGVSNTSSNIGSGRYKWTAYIEADKSVLSKIAYVEYRLPDAYGDKALRKVSTPRVGKYPFSLTDAAFETFSIGVTIFFKDGSRQKLSDYTLTFGGSIINPGGVAITPLIKLKQQHSVDIPIPEFQGAISVYVDDIHDVFKRKPFYIKISKSGSSIKESKLNSGPNVSLPFSYGGHEYVLTGYTKTSIFEDNLFFRIFRKNVYAK